MARAWVLTVVLVTLGLHACGIGQVRLGDPVLIVEYHNEASEAVRMSYEYLDGGEQEQGCVVQPGSVVREPIMVSRAGIRIRAVGVSSGKTIVDRSLLWKDIDRRAPLVIDLRD